MTSQNTKLIDSSRGLFSVIDSFYITIPQGLGCRWNNEDIEEGSCSGAIFRAYHPDKDGNIGLDSAYIMLVDASNDDTEPDVIGMEQIDVPNLDSSLRRDISEQLKNDGMTMSKWMSSQLDEMVFPKVLITAYIAEDNGLQRQFIAVRFQIGFKKVVAIGNFDIARADIFAKPILKTLHTIKLKYQDDDGFFPEGIHEDVWLDRLSTLNSERDSCHQAFAYIQSEEYEKAYKAFLPLVEAGNATATCDVGLMYLRGLLGERDLSKAISYFQRAVLLGSTMALDALGSIYKEESLGYMNIDTWIRYLRIAAQYGNSNAMMEFGKCLFNGIGVEKDIPKAIETWERASEAGESNADFNLGYNFLEGRGVKKDYSRALYYFNKGSDRGHTQCQVLLGEMYEQGIGVDPDNAAAFRLYQSSCNANNVVGCHHLGWLYETGKGVNLDYKKSIECYQLAADQNLPISLNCLGSLIGRGLGCDVDRVKSAELYKQAADLGDVIACSNVGVRLLNGDGITQDIPLGVKYLKYAAKQGDANSVEVLKQLQEKYSLELD
jgi:TPR repeat protein